VRRHGPMVLAACRRQLRGDDAEDAFQATFLVLARRAAAVARPERLGPWLYGVAFRVARQARRRCARAVLLESPESLAASPDDPARHEADAIIDEELSALPDRLRAVLILCCLQGASREEAAARLNVSPGAVKGLLERGRQRLRERLIRRGLIGCVLPPLIPGAAVPERLAATAIQTIFNNGASDAVASLAQGVLNAMTFFRWQTWLALAGVVLLCASAALALPSAGTQGAKPLALRSSADKEKPKQGSSEPEPKKAAEIDLKTKLTALVWVGDRQLAALDESAQVRLWEPASGKVTKLERQKGAVTVLTAARDGKTLVMGGEIGATVWDVGTRKLLWSVERDSGLTALALSPDGKTLAVAGNSNEVLFYQTASGKARGTYRLPDLKAGVRSLAYSGDGKRLVVGVLITLNEGRFWNELNALDVTTGKELAKTSGSGGKDKERDKTTDHRLPLVASPDGKWYAGAAWDDSILTSSPFVSYRSQARGVTGLAYLPDNATLAVAARDGTVRLVNPKKLTGDEKEDKKTAEKAKPGDAAILKGQGTVVALSLSPDGKTLAWANASGKVKLIAVAKMLKDHAVEQKK
jgi:RNA polymerase sigma factor (sigma-70 family)